MKLVCQWLALVGMGIASAAMGADLRVGAVFDRGGKDDQSFNAAAYKGLMEAKDKLKVQVKWVESTDDNSYEPMLKAFATKNFDLIIGVGFAQTEAINKVAAAFPKLRFVLVDAKAKEENVRSLVFAEHEGAFVVGALAAMKSQTGIVGFVGGMEVPLIRRFALGYTAGVQHVAPKTKVVTNYVGVTVDSWNNPPKAKELALSQYASGVDVIFAAAGASGIGVFDAAEDKKKFVIGVDSNQNGMKPGLVLTSMIKRVDLAVFKACEDLAHGKFSGGVQSYGLGDKGVDFALDQHNDKLITPTMRAKIEGIKTAIIAGKIKVPDYYQTKSGT